MLNILNELGLQTLIWRKACLLACLFALAKKRVSLDSFIVTATNRKKKLPENHFWMHQLQKQQIYGRIIVLSKVNLFNFAITFGNSYINLSLLLVELIHWCCLFPTWITWGNKNKRGLSIWTQGKTKILIKIPKWFRWVQSRWRDEKQENSSTELTLTSGQIWHFNLELIHGLVRFTSFLPNLSFTRN